MNVRTLSDVFRILKGPLGTPMEKMTRRATERRDEEAAKRQVKVARLREARLEKEAIASADPAARPAKARRKIPQIQARQ
jgi:hypothetical protein